MLKSPSPCARSPALAFTGDEEPHRPFHIDPRRSDHQCIARKIRVIVGLAFGWLAVLAIPASIINQLSIPAVTLVIYVIIATLAGLLAASLPARRAARLNVLEAIAHE